MMRRTRPIWMGVGPRVLLALAFGLLAGPSPAQVLLGGPKDAPVDQILLSYDATAAYRARARHSVLAVEVRRKADAHLDPQLVPPWGGAAVAVRIGRVARLLTPTIVVQDAVSISVVLPDGRRVPGRTVAALPGTTVSVVAVEPWPADVVPLELAPDETIRVGVAGLTLTRLGIDAREVVSKVHLLERVDEQGTPVWVTDVVRPWGFPVLDPDLRLMALPFAWAHGTSERTLALAAPELRKMLAKCCDAQPQAPPSGGAPAGPGHGR